jgi:hypothetical protein
LYVTQRFFLRLFGDDFIFGCSSDLADALGWSGPGVLVDQYALEGVLLKPETVYIGPDISKVSFLGFSLFRSDSIPGELGCRFDSKKIFASLRHPKRSFGVNEVKGLLDSLMLLTPFDYDTYSRLQSWYTRLGFSIPRFSHYFVQNIWLGLEAPGETPPQAAVGLKSILNCL